MAIIPVHIESIPEELTDKALSSLSPGALYLYAGASKKTQAQVTRLLKRNQDIAIKYEQYKAEQPERDAYISELEDFKQQIAPNNETLMMKYILARMNNSQPRKRGMPMAGILQKAYDITNRYLASLRPTPADPSNYTYYSAVFIILHTMFKSFWADFKVQPSGPWPEEESNQPYCEVSHEEPSLVFFIPDRSKGRSVKFIILQETGLPLPVDDGASDVDLLLECVLNHYILVEETIYSANSETTGAMKGAIAPSNPILKFVDPNLDGIIASLVASFFVDDRVRATFVDLSSP